MSEKLFAAGFEDLRTATFSGEQSAKFITMLANQAADMDADSMTMTLHYNDGAKPGQYVPEIILKAVKYNPDEDDDEDVEDEE